jgi:branched-chain amino acid transport system substrate-binding protein
VFRACFTDPFQGAAAAGYAFDQLKARKAAILWNPQNATSMQLSDEFESSFRKKGGKIVERASYLGAEKDVAAMLNRLRWRNPDIIYLPTSGTATNETIIQARVKGIKKPFLGGSEWASADMALDAADGLYYTDHFSASDPRPEVARFRDAFGKEFKEATGRPRVPDAIAALSYDAANMLLQAIQSAGSDDTDAVRVALERIRFNGVTGQMSFDDKHNPIKPAVIIAIRGGKRELAGTYRP